MLIKVSGYCLPSTVELTSTTWTNCSSASFHCSWLYNVAARLHMLVKVSGCLVRVPSFASPKPEQTAPQHPSIAPGPGTSLRGSPWWKVEGCFWPTIFFRVSMTGTNSSLASFHRSCFKYVAARLPMLVKVSR